MEPAEDLLSHGVRVALVKAISLGRLEASSGPTTRHTIGCTMLAFVDKYIVLKGAIPFGLRIYQSRVARDQIRTTYGEIVKQVQQHFRRLAAVSCQNHHEV